MTLLIRKQLNPEEIVNAPHLFNNYQPLLISSGIISRHEYTKYLIKSMQYSLKNDKNSRLLIKDGREISGMALLKSKHWDSKFFKLSISTIEHVLLDGSLEKKEAGELEKELLTNSINLAKKQGVKILYATTYSNRASLIDTLGYLKFNFICGELEGVSTKDDAPFLLRENKLNAGYKFRKYRKNDYSQIMKIAREISVDVESKFSLTPYLREKEKQDYYLESIRNCCLGVNADNIFVALRNDIPIGFLCYRYDRRFEEALNRKLSFLVMGGILRAEREKKIGTHFFNWSHRQVLKTSEIILGRVYLHNLPMMKFILGRRFMHSFDILYTFCKEL